jgi:hypothetical protein
LGGRGRRGSSQIKAMASGRVHLGSHSILR